MTSIEKAKATANILNSKKALNIEVIGVEGISDITNYFVIATGTANLHVRSLSEDLEFQLNEMGEKPLHIEGYASGTWVLLDYGDVVVHIFTGEMRDFYDLSRLWADGKKIELTLD